MIEDLDQIEKLGEGIKGVKWGFNRDRKGNPARIEQ